jgi:hypothetical protein
MRRLAVNRTIDWKRGLAMALVGALMEFDLAGAVIGPARTLAALERAGAAVRQARR